MAMACPRQRTAPAYAGTNATLACSVRYCPISMSGCRPGSSRRYIFSASRSPTTTVVFDWSAPIGRCERSAGSSPGSTIPGRNDQSPWSPPAAIACTSGSPIRSSPVRYR